MSEESTTPDLVQLTRDWLATGGRRDPDAVTRLASEPILIEAAYRHLTLWREAERPYEVHHGVWSLGSGVVFGIVCQTGRPVGTKGHVDQREGWISVWEDGLQARLTVYGGHRRGSCCRRTPRKGAAGG